MQILRPNSYEFTLQVKTFGPGCRRIVADCFWKIDGIENGVSLLCAEDFGKGELTLSVLAAVVGVVGERGGGRGGEGILGISDGISVPFSSGTSKSGSISINRDNRSTRSRRSCIRGSIKSNVSTIIIISCSSGVNFNCSGNAIEINNNTNNSKISILLGISEVLLIP